MLSRVAGKGGHDDEVHSSKTAVPYNTNNNVLSNIESHQTKVEEEENDDDDKYPNLRHSLFNNDKEEDELDFGDQFG
ncbi:hypothetical protein LguiA_000009 [Lonicera macranthoides]